MTDHRKLLKRAARALDFSSCAPDLVEKHEAIKRDIRAALVEPEQRCEYIRSSGTTHWCALAEPEQDWSLLEATQTSLREHVARIKEFEANLKEKNDA